jgi:hypothetical protein
MVVPVEEVFPKEQDLDFLARHNKDIPAEHHRQAVEVVLVRLV